MSHNEPHVVLDGESTILHTHERNIQEEHHNGDEYSKEQMSKFGTAFLPYASQLESVDRKKITRKKKGKNRRKKLTKVTNIPGYKGTNKTKGKKYDNHRTNNNRKINRKTDELARKDNNASGKLEWHGDIMTFDDCWPNVDKRTTIRLFNINLNGIPANNDYLEWEMTIAFLMDMQVDIFGLSEINLDMNNGIIKDKLMQGGKHFDPYIRFATSSSLQKLGNSPFKMGGTITGTNGCWSGRIKDQGSDNLGRWSYIKLQAKREQYIVIITVYVPRKRNKVGGGGTTIYDQMEADLLMKTGQLKDPKKELLKDLHSFIGEETKKGNLIILMGDMNEDLGKEDGQMRNFLTSLDMTMPYLTRHGTSLQLPPTHDRGRTCIDMIGCSKGIDENAIVRAGYAPFYFNFFTDHRGVYVDIDIESIFNSTRPDTTRQIYKRFTTLHVPKCSKYLQKLEELMEEAKIFTKVDKLESKYSEENETETDESREKLINETKILFNKVSTLMISAEKWAGPKPYRDGFPDSPKLRRTAFKVIRIKKYLRLVSLGMINAEEDERIKVSKELKMAQMELRDNQKSANLLRQVHLERLADKRCYQWQMKSAEALHIIKESEKSRKMHGKHRRLLHKNNEGTLRSLLIPAPVTGIKNNIKDPRLYTSTSDSQTMFNILLKRNFNHLLQSQDSMFSNGPMLDKCGWYGNDEGMEEVLKGVLNAETMAREYPKYGREGVEFLKALRYTRDEEGNQTKPFTWKFGVEEYTNVFNKTNESTACGPSGLHMSHWKAACERKEIARVHAFFMWAAFEKGFTYERWEQSWHCMIKKLKQPILHKLRIVQPFEGDFNAGLKYLIGKKMMSHMNQEGLHDQETFGSRTGKTAPEALINLQLLFDHYRTWKLPIAIIFNDAIGCYDRIVPTLSELAMRARGCPKGIAQCHTLTQKGMKHRIRIATGVSEGIIKFAKEEKITMSGNKIICIQGKTGGIGQGGGAGPLAWIAVIDVMLEAYRKICPGAEALDPLQLYTICYWLISYVDDNTIVTGFGNETSKNEILTTIRSNLGSWRRLLQLTGGDIDVVKSKWCVMKWKFSSDWGIPTIETKEEFPGEVSMKETVNGIENVQRLERLEPSEAERVLGVRLPLDGNMKTEFIFRCRQMRALSTKVNSAPIDQRDAWVIYESRYRAIIRYPLPVTMFDSRQCNTIQRPIINAFLPKMGLNRHTPRVVIYGPKTLGGLELMDLRVEQIATQWETTIGHMRRHDRAGKGLYLTAHDTQIETGSGEPFYLLDPKKCNYTTECTRWRYLWTALHQLDMTIEMYQLWLPTPINDNDRSIMDIAMKDRQIKESKWPLLKHINMCRIYIRAIFISDLTLDGIQVHEPYLSGKQRSGSQDTISFPTVTRPTENQWRVWKSFIFRNFLSPGLTINPKLGITEVEQERPSLPKSEVEMMKESLDGENSIQEMIRSLPRTLQLFVGETEIPQDEGLALGEAIVDGTCVGASDGSLIRKYKETKGSHGYVLSSKDPDIEEIRGWGASPESDGMSSLTTEHYGLIGLLVILHIVCKKYKLCRDECFDSVTIYIDNKTVVERGKVEQTLINLRDYAVPDQGLWSITTELLAALPIAVELKWVKGHQDTNEHGAKIHGPFQHEVYLNILVDELARKGMELGKGRITKKPTLSAEAIAIYTKDDVQVTDLRKYIIQIKNGGELENYIKDKKGWNDEIMSTIDWEGIESMMNSAGSSRRTRLVQLMHNWQNVGSQKRKFRDARLKLNSDNPLNPTEEEVNCHKCPDGCEEEEISLHYLECPMPHAKQRRKRGIKNALHRMKNLRTYEGIISLMGYILNQISEREEMNFEWEYLKKDGELSLIAALEGQEKIGWKSFCQGYCHSEWSRVQSRHYAKLGTTTRTLNIKRWKRMMCEILADFSLECWKQRNETIHGKEKDETRKKQLDNIRKQVKGLYARKGELHGQYNKKVFNMPLKKRLRMGIQSSKIWVGLAEEVLRLNREKATRNKLFNWLEP